MLDKLRLMELKDIMDDDFNDLVDIFFEDTNERFSNLKQLISKGNPDNLEIKIEAHTLKGSSGNLFATDLQQMFFRLERLAFEDKMDELGDLLLQLENEIKVVFNELLSYKNISN